jgi:hypothetical protein
VSRAPVRLEVPRVTMTADRVSLMRSARVAVNFATPSFGPGRPEREPLKPPRLKEREGAGVL